MNTNCKNLCNLGQAFSNYVPASAESNQLFSQIENHQEDLIFRQATATPENQYADIAEQQTLSSQNVIAHQQQQ